MPHLVVGGHICNSVYNNNYSEAITYSEVTSQPLGPLAENKITLDHTDKYWNSLNFFEKNPS